MGNPPPWRLADLEVEQTGKKMGTGFPSQGETNVEAVCGRRSCSNQNQKLLAALVRRVIMVHTAFDGFAEGPGVIDRRRGRGLLSAEETAPCSRR